MGQVVAPERKEACEACELIRNEARSWKLDHGAHAAGEEARRFGEDLPVYAVEHSAQGFELGGEGDHGNEDFELDRHALVGAVARREQHGAQLHVVEAGDGEACPHASMTERWVRFAMSLGRFDHFFQLEIEPIGDRLERLFLLRKEFFQRAIEQANRDGPSLHRSKDLDEVVPLGALELHEPLAALLIIDRE